MDRITFPYRHLQALVSDCTQEHLTCCGCRGIIKVNLGLRLNGAIWHNDSKEKSMARVQPNGTDIAPKISKNLTWKSKKKKKRDARLAMRCTVNIWSKINGGEKSAKKPFSRHPQGGKPVSSLALGRYFFSADNCLLVCLLSSSHLPKPCHQTHTSCPGKQRFQKIKENKTLLSHDANQTDCNRGEGI